MQATKKAKPKPSKATKDSQGKGCARAAARRHSLACVRGRAYNTALAASGIWLNAKKVPHRKVIGKMTKLLKVFIL